jgi:hypothetical protein
LCEKSEKSITFKNKKNGISFINTYVEPYFGCGNFSNFSRQLQLYYFDIAITIAIIIAIYRVPLEERLSCACSALGRGGAGALYGSTNFFGVFF